MIAQHLRLQYVHEDTKPMVLPQMLDYFGLDDHIAAVQVQLAVAPAPQRAGLLAGLAWYLRQRDSQRALALVQESQALLAQAGHDERLRIEGRLALVQGETSILSSQPDAAAGFADAARRHLEALDDLAGTGDAWLLAAAVADGQGDRPQRDAAYAAAAGAYERTGDPVRRCLVGLIRRDSSAARALPADAEALKHVGLEALVQRNQSRHCFQQANYGQAASNSHRAHELAILSGQWRLAVVEACNAGAAYGNLNDYADALEWAERALDLARRTGWPGTVAICRRQLAGVLCEMGRAAQAWPILQDALADLAHAKDSLSWMLACHEAGEVLLRLQANEEALRWLAECERVALLRGATGNLCASAQGRAMALSRLGRVAEAIEAIEASLAWGRGDALLEAQTLRRYAELARSHRLPLPAGATALSSPLHYMEAALQTARGIEGFNVPFDWLSELSRDYEAAGDLVRALDAERRAAAAREAADSRKTSDLATALQVRHETERVRAEAAHHQALAEAETRRADAAAAANEAKSAFLANMSHELRSPLNAMLGFTRLLLRDPALDSRHEDLAIVMRSGEHLYALINQVLDMSKIEAGRVQLVETEFDLHALLEELREMFSAQAVHKGLALAVCCEADAPQHVRGDAFKLRQVLINLLSNAVKFTPHGEVHLAVAATAGGVGFTVSDTGVGIAPEHLARLGQAFVQAEAGQRSAEGTGLGLAISRGFVETMGGELRLTSTPGQGTSASFVLPLPAVERTPAAPAAPHRRITGLAPGTAPQRILAVDDRAEGRLLLARTLAPLGFEVREAADGQQAIDAWRQWSPHLILMDMRMPVMDGREATRRIKATAQGHATVVIALTASSFEEEREQILAAGCDDFLRKPFQEDVLLEMMARHLKLEYLREDAGPLPTPPEPDAHRLARLPQEVRMQLLAALDRLDVQAVEQAIEAVREHDAGCAAALAPLARRFQYERIRALIA